MTAPARLGHPSPTTSEDYARVIGLLEAIAPGATPIHCLTVEGQPYSKARPRFSGKGHAYNSEKQRAHEETLAWKLKRSVRELAEGNVAIVCLFYRQSHRRIDADNLAKQVLDAANGICWRDDSQVTAIVSLVEWDPERPRTVIGLAGHQSSLDRSPRAPVPCRHCGEPVLPPARTVQRKYCSRSCAGAAGAKVTRAVVPCSECGKDFQRSGARVLFCSNPCRLRGLHKRNRIHPPGECAKCHKKLDNRYARLCRDCWRKHGSKLPSRRKVSDP